MDKELGKVKPESLVKNDLSLLALDPRETVGSAIIGKSGGKQVLKPMRYLRAIGIYNSPTTSDANGFNKVQNLRVLGNDQRYAININSSIEVFSRHLSDSGVKASSATIKSSKISPALA
nr:hypothetical protein HK105_003918 [Polyrhizophydium stewartii]